VIEPTGAASVVEPAQDGLSPGTILPVARGGRGGVAKERRVVASRRSMDFIEGLFKAALMLVFLVLVIGAIAALFMIVFGIATGIDERIQD
jgi:hypothetical protein